MLLILVLVKITILKKEKRKTDLYHTGRKYFRLISKKKSLSGFL